MAITFESAGVDPIYNAGVFRLPGLGDGPESSYQGLEQLFADLLPNKDIVGGQVAKDFVGLVGTPLVGTGTAGVYAAAVYDDSTPGSEVYSGNGVDGLLLLATDAYDGPRQINVVKGGTVKTTVGALRAMDATQLEVLAAALGGKYDAVFNTIKF